MANRADALRVELERVRHVEQTWESVRQMVDEKTSQTWDGSDRAYSLFRLGLRHRPDHALVALTTSLGSSSDPVDEAVRRDGFQRAAVALASSIGNVVAGQVGDHGVVFLSAGAGTAQRRKTHLIDLAERARTLARRFGLEPHFGASGSIKSATIHHVYEAAWAPPSRH